MKGSVHTSAFKLWFTGEKRSAKMTIYLFIFITFAFEDVNRGVPVFAILHTRFLNSKRVKTKYQRAHVKLRGCKK
jgi:hypothetical protein